MIQVVTVICRAGDTITQFHFEAAKPQWADDALTIFNIATGEQMARFKNDFWAGLVIRQVEELKEKPEHELHRDEVKLQYAEDTAAS